jgi:hypothetical protein
MRKMLSFGVWRRVGLARADVSEEPLLSLLVTDNVVPSSRILSTLLMVAARPSESSVLKDPNGIISLKTAFFIVIAVKTSNLAINCLPK